MALCWIKGKSRSWKSWVENRLVKIREVIDGNNNWFFVAGENNPSDIPTRPDNLTHLVDSIWFGGSAFLKEETVVVEEFEVEKNSQSDEVVYESKRSTHVDQSEVVCKLSLTVTFLIGEIILNKVIDINRYSSIQIFLRVTAYVLRFTMNLNKRLRGLNEEIIMNDCWRNRLQLTFVG